MSQAPNLLNDDGTASIATALMSSHHAFRRDLARFAHALVKVRTRRLYRALRARLGYRKSRWRAHAVARRHRRLTGGAVLEAARAGTVVQ